MPKAVIGVIQVSSNAAMRWNENTALISILCTDKGAKFGVYVAGVYLYFFPP